MAGRLARHDDDDSINGSVGPDLADLLREPDAPVRVMRHELLNALREADVALDGDSNDAEHDALYELRELIANWIEDPAGRTQDAATLALLIDVAEDAMNLLSCNCSYDSGTEPRCDGSCTHGMAKRALAGITGKKDNDGKTE